MRDYNRNQRGRMFESNFLEFFSKVHPAAPFVFWVPIVAYVLASNLVSGVVGWQQLWLLPVGFFMWQMAEYVIHKKAFHWLGIGPISRRFHDIVHGFHHKYPDDDQRLVMPLAVSISLASLIALGLWAIHAPAYTVPWWVGFVAGYLWYDFMHWSQHFRRPLTDWGKRLRAHHMSHHFNDPETNFGISNMWLDRTLGSMRSSSVHDKEPTGSGTAGVTQ